MKRNVAGLALAGQSASCVSTRLPSRLRSSAPQWIAAALSLLLGLGIHFSSSHGLLLPTLQVAHADNVQYSYDQLGRIVEASDTTTGQVVRYTYDAAGNITSQTIESIATLSISYFTPEAGPVGTQVTISGTGFSATASSNAVKFNGVTATVQSATEVQLVVTVPSAATSGPISVQVGTNSVSSSTSFTVTAGPIGPTITNLLPAVGAYGSAVTIVGTDFDPMPNGNLVFFNNAQAEVTQSTATTISVIVPPNTGSGPVQVITSDGSAVSPMDFIVPPNGYGSTNIGSTGEISTTGTPTKIIATAGQISVQLFNGTEGQLLTVGVNSTSIASATIKVFDPNGNAVVSGVTVTAAGQGVQIPQLLLTGTYAIVVDPGTNAGTISLKVVPPQVGTLALNGSATAVTLTPPGKSALLTFRGTQGTYASIALSAVTLSAGAVSIIAPNGALLDSRTFTTAGTVVQPQLPATGTYTVVVTPMGSVGGTLSVSLTTSTSPTLGLNQPAYNLGLTNTTPVNLTFQAAAGEYVALAASVTPAAAPAITLTIINPDGSQLTTGSIASGAGATVLNLGPLAAGGTFTVVVQQASAASTSVALTVSTPIVGTLTANGTTNTTTMQLAGQGIVYTVSGTAGQFLAVDFGLSYGVTTTSCPDKVLITILQPDGLQLATGTVQDAANRVANGCIGNGVVGVGPLQDTGTYTILVQQVIPLFGGEQVSATLTAPVSNTLTAGNTVTTTMTTPGQGLLFTASGSAGQYLSLEVALSYNVTTPVCPDQVSVSVVAPNGAPVGSGTIVDQLGNTQNQPNCYSSGVINIGPLPLSGTYTVALQQTGAGFFYGENVAVTLAVPVTGTLTANAATTTTTMTTPGQALLYTTSGTAGQYLAVDVALSYNVTNSICPDSVKVTILAPDGSTLQSVKVADKLGNPYNQPNCYNSAVINVGPLPSTGTYTVLLQDTGVGFFYGENVAVTLSSPATGTLTANGTTATTTMTTAGQGLQYTTSGTAGQYLALAVGLNYNVSQTNCTESVSVTVLQPGGAPLLNAQGQPTGGTVTDSGSCAVNGIFNLGPLPQSGTYSILVQQGGIGLFYGEKLALTLSSPLAGALSVGSATPVSVSIPGQGMQQTFSVSSGQYVTAQVSEAYGSSISSAALTVFNPNGTQLKTQQLSASTCNTCSGYAGSTTLDLGAVPQSGTYTVLAQQKDMLGTGTGTLTFAINAETPVSGTTTSNLSSASAGQSVTFTFSAVAAQNTSVALSNVVVAPSGGTSSYVTIANPDGTALYGQYCYSTNPGCELSLTNLPQTGTYTVTVPTPTTTQTISFTETVSQDVTGVLTAGTPASVNLATVGQSALYTFTATTGQTFAVNVGSIATTPASTIIDVYVYNSSGTIVGSGSSASGITINLPSLAADTYRVLIAPQYPVTGSLQLTLDPGETGALSTSGTSTSITAEGPGQEAYFTFSGVAGQSMSLALSNVVVTPSGSTASYVTVFNPDGTTLTSTYCYSTNPGCEINLMNLPQTGTYSVTVPPVSSTQQMSFTATLSLDVSGVLSVGTPVNVGLGSVGQSALYSFTASSNQTVAVSVGSINVTPANTSVYLVVYNSSGTQVLSGSSPTGVTLNLPNLAAGTYTVLVIPQYPVTGTVQLTLDAGETAALSSSGSSTNITAQAPGENAYFTFSGVAGESLSLALSNLVVTPSGGTDTFVTVYNPDGTTLTSTYCYSTNPGCEINLINLPQTGTYTLTVPAISSSQKLSFTVTLSQDVTAPLSAGTPVNVNLTATGQSAEFSFAVAAGQTYAVNTAGITTTPASTYVYLNVYNSSGTLVASTSSQSGATVNLANLAAGTYSVLITPQYPITGSVKVTLASQLGGTLTPSGSTLSQAATVPGQNGYYSFAATAGQSYAVGLTSLSLTPTSSTYVYVTAYQPNGGSLGSVYCYTTAPDSCDLSLRNVPATGTYSIVVTAQTLQTTMSYGITLSQDAGGAIPIGTAQTLNLSSPGEQGQYTFSATAGQTFAVGLSSIVTSPAASTVAASVYNAAGTVVATASSTASSFAVNLPNLAAGTYTVLVVPSNGATATMQVTLAAQLGGTLTPNGTTLSQTAAVAGQNGYYSFSGTAGQSFGLGLTALSLTPTSSTYVYITAYQPSGGSLGSVYCYTSAPDSCDLTFLRNLPAIGTYSIVITPQSPQTTMSYGITFSQDAGGSIPTGTPQTLNLSSSGEEGQYTFTATADQTFTVGLSSIVTSPAGTTVTATVYNAAGTVVAAASSAASSFAVNLPNLAAGMYTVLVVPSNGATASMQVTLAAQLGGTLTPNGTTLSQTAAVAGQNGYYSFSGTAGQSFGLGLTALSLTPTSSTYVYITAYEPSGGSLGSLYCYTTAPDSCDLTVLRNLPATGTYSIVITPQSPQTTMSYGITFSQDASGTLTDGTPQSVNLSSSGEEGQYTFTATAGESVTVSVASIATTPANTTVSATVYNANGTSVGSATSATSITINLSSLPAGTYTIVLVPSYAATGTMQVSYQ
jgi:YD repeat-containing protein